MAQPSLFDEEPMPSLMLAAGAFYLPRFCLHSADQLWHLVSEHLTNFPATHMMMPMGYPMSVKTSSMGHLGWVSDAKGYGYQQKNPVTNHAWPPIPTTFLRLAEQAANAAGYRAFIPDTCLINLYTPGAKMGLHQDKDELDFKQPIVSVSLGIDATFLFGGAKRNEPVKKCVLEHGDVVVFGGESRRNYHGIMRVKQSIHPVLGELRCNLTFRKAA